MDDAKIIQLFWDRSQDALTEVQSKYGQYCFSIANNVLSDSSDSEECVNDCLLKAWNSIPPGNPACLKTYLGKLTREIAVDRLRKKTAAKRVPESETIPFDERDEIIGDRGPDASVGVRELSRLISAFLRSQKEEDRNLFIRRYWYGDPIAKICERYGYGKSRVLVKLKRTRDRLARFLTKEGYLI